MYTQNKVKEIKYKVINHNSKFSHLEEKIPFEGGKLPTNRTAQRSQQRESVLHYLKDCHAILGHTVSNTPFYAKEVHKIE